MKPTDHSRRFLLEQTAIRGQHVLLQESYRSVISTSNYPPAVANLLGQFLAAAVLLSTTLKFTGRLVLQVRGSGPVSLLMAECTHEQQIRGIARHQAAGALSGLALLGEGVLAITVEPEQGESYQGIVPLTGETLADSLSFYFAQSEQLPTLFHLAASDEIAAGVLLQQMPAGDQGSSNNEQRGEQWAHASTLAATLSDVEIIDSTTEVLLQRLYHQQDVRLFAPLPVSFHCSCCRQRTATALLSIGEAEVMQILAEQGQVEMTCEFCHRRYCFDDKDIGALFTGQSSDSVH